MNESINTFIAKNINTMEDYNRVAACLKVKFKQLSAREAARFFVGDRVKFTGKHGITVIGTITGINIKTINVTADGGAKWRVSPGLLSAFHKAA